MQEMVIYGVSFDMVGKQPIVLLKAVDTNKFLPIWIGHPEAAAILMKLQGATTPRPMTHDLLYEMLGELDVDCTRVAVTELRENTFYATITLSINGRDVEIDSRPSDALALAVRAGAPIFAAEDVIAESAIEFEHEVEDQEDVVEQVQGVPRRGHAGGLRRRQRLAVRAPRARRWVARDELPVALAHRRQSFGGVRIQLGEPGLVEHGQDVLDERRARGPSTGRTRARRGGTGRRASCAGSSSTSQRSSGSWRMCIFRLICGCRPSPPNDPCVDQEAGDDALVAFAQRHRRGQ